jgi:cytosylglucuronate decarboxylase
MFVRITENCNSGCFMCKYKHKKDSYYIEMEKLKGLLEIMKQSGTYRMIRFTGGEPLLHPEILEIISMFHKEGFLTSIITNGYLLPDYYKKLIESGLDQVICSIDGCKAKTHNKLRGFEGCFEKAITGLKLIKQEKNDINLRFNTVVSSYNIGELKEMLKLTDELNIDEWSIIPIRYGKENLWQKNIPQYKSNYIEFKKIVNDLDKPIFLGYSKAFAGRTEEEIDNYFINAIRYTPDNKCHTPERIRFYIPDINLLVPCNCVSHRINEIDSLTRESVNLEQDAIIMKDWLIDNGPKKCSGCEPLNAYFGEHPEIIDSNIFLF